MRLHSAVSIFALATLGACARSSTVTAPAPVSTPSTASVPVPAAPAADVPEFANIASLPRNWHMLDLQTDRVAGVSAERALKELLAGQQPKRTIVVAVIDGGIDTAHADLRANLWQNPKETARNGRDDDTNGYVDDVRGWNFIGGRDGRNVAQDTYEATRLLVGCRRKAPSGDYSALPVAERDVCMRATDKVNTERAEMNGMLGAIRQAAQIFDGVSTALRTAMKADSLTDENVAAFQPATPDLTRAKQAYQQLRSQGISKKEIDGALKDVTSRLNFGLDTAFNPRPIVGDDTLNVNEKSYGNADVMGPDASHGTHVSGIIGAVRGNGEGIDGIATAVRIMAIRTVPDGDERDKDVANAIRYAVDNGAQIINMSFGKGFSPQKAAVDAAVKYADSKGVLMIHAAGNDGANNDSTPSFPTPRYLEGGRPEHWIEVGASSWRGGANLAADFSNYGSGTVDLFAPGVAIHSTMPGGGYERQDGTSMAAPVVAGVAALVMSYFPELSARDVKRVLLNSAVRHPNQTVLRPGSEVRVPFGSLSATGGIVNAFKAVQMAQQMVRGAQ